MRLLFYLSLFLFLFFWGFFCHFLANNNLSEKCYYWRSRLTLLTPPCNFFCQLKTSFYPSNHFYPNFVNIYLPAEKLLTHWLRHLNQCKTMIKTGFTLWLKFLYCMDCLIVVHKYWKNTGANTAQKMKFFIKDFFGKCDQIHSLLRIWTYLLKKSIMKNFILCAV